MKTSITVYQMFKIFANSDLNWKVTTTSTIASTEFLENVVSLWKWENSMPTENWGLLWPPYISRA